MHIEPTQPTAKGPRERFVGDVYVDMLLPRKPEPSRVAVGRVHFTPGAHTAWHAHPVGQTLHVLEGVALVGTRDGTVLEAHAGQTVYTPPGEEHWHGATPESLMIHLAIQEDAADGEAATWLEHVTDEQYHAPRTR